MARKGESIFKRKDGRWEGRYIKERNLQGKAVYGYVYGSSYGKAKEKLRLRAAGMEEAPKPGKAEAAILFDAVAERWLREKRESVKESSYVKYRNLLKNYILPQLGQEAVLQITPDRLNVFYRRLLSEGGAKNQGLSPKTVSDIFSVIRGVLRSAKQQKIPVNSTGTEITIRTAHRKMSILSSSEQEILAEYLAQHRSGRNRGILLCMYTGIRLGELCALRWEDVSAGERTIYVHKTMQRLQAADGGERKTKVVVTAPKSPCSIRMIPIPTVLWPFLEEFRTGTGYFLTGNETYVEPRTMENHFKRVLKQAGIDHKSFHCLRHTFATRCVEVGFDIKTLSEILGHANTTITMNRYVHPTMQMKRDNMERLSSLFLVR